MQHIVHDQIVLLHYFKIKQTSKTIHIKALYARYFLVNKKKNLIYRSLKYEEKNSYFFVNNYIY